MATKKAAGTAKNLRDSNPKYLGIKKNHNQPVIAGNILIRQRGTKYLAGTNVGMGKDHTLFALTQGVVSFSQKRKRNFDGTSTIRKVVNITQTTATIVVSKKDKKAAVSAKPTATKSASKAGKAGADKLELIEGIGPKINGLLAAAGIKTFAQVTDAKVEALQAVLDKAGARYAIHDPSTWGEQAVLLRDGKMEEFKKLTKELIGGKRK
jgi:large subunit ribosomal protein L27